MRRYGAVVDDAPAARVLALHDLEGFLRAEEGAGEVRVDHRLPLLERQVLERHGGRADASVVEEEVEPAERVLRPGKKGWNGFRVGEVRRYQERGRARGLPLGGHGFEEILAATGQDDGVTLPQQSQSRMLPDPSARARDDCNLARGSHVVDFLLTSCDRR